MEKELNEDDLAYLDYLAAETEIERHKQDPLDTELCARVQAYTFERLHRYLENEGLSLDQVVNEALVAYLYDLGE